MKDSTNRIVEYSLKMTRLGKAEARDQQEIEELLELEKHIEEFRRTRERNEGRESAA